MNLQILTNIQNGFPKALIFVRWIIMGFFGFVYGFLFFFPFWFMLGFFGMGLAFLFVFWSVINQFKCQVTQGVVT